MGYLKHHTIVVTGWQEEKVLEAREKAVSIFNEAFAGYLGCRNIGDILVSPILSGMVNSQYSFFIAPDGSKEGWEASDMGDNARDNFIKWLKDGRENDEHYLDYFEISFGGDDDDTIIENSSSDCEYKDEM